MDTDMNPRSLWWMNDLPESEYEPGDFDDDKWDFEAIADKVQEPEMIISWVKRLDGMPEDIIARCFKQFFQSVEVDVLGVRNKQSSLDLSKNGKFLPCRITTDKGFFLIYNYLGVEGFPEDYHPDLKPGTAIPGVHLADFLAFNMSAGNAIMTFHADSKEGIQFLEAVVLKNLAQIEEVLGTAFTSFEALSKAGLTMYESHPGYGRLVFSENKISPKVGKAGFGYLCALNWITTGRNFYCC